MKSIKYISLILTLAITNLFSEIPITQIKTFQGVFKPDYIEGIPPEELQFNENKFNPTWGAIFWNSPYVENLYKLGCEEHGSIKLIHDLFFVQHDEVSFDATCLPLKIAYYFSPEDIGKIIGLIDNYQTSRSFPIKEQLTNLIDHIESEYTNTIKTTMLTYLEKEQKKYIGNIKTLNAEKTDLEAIQATNPNEESKIRLNQIEKDLKYNTDKKIFTDGAIKQIRQITDNKINFKLFKKSKTNFTEELIQGLNEEFYLPNNIINILLTFHWKKSNSIEDFINLFYGIYSTLINKNNLFNEQLTRTLNEAQTKNRTSVPTSNLSKNEFFKILNQYMPLKEFTQEDFIHLKEQNPEETINNLENLALAYLGFFIFESKLPKEVQMSGYTTVINDSDRKIKTFPDCGETSLLNFFIALTFDTKNKTFNTRLLTDIGATESLINFFRNLKVEKIHTQETHNKWADIVKNAPNAKYHEEGDLRSGISNILGVISMLIPGITTFKSLEDKINLTNTKISITFETDPRIKNIYNFAEIEIKKSEEDPINIRWDFLEGHFHLSFPPKAHTNSFRFLIEEIRFNLTTTPITNGNNKKIIFYNLLSPQENINKFNFTPQQKLLSILSQETIDIFFFMDYLKRYFNFTTEPWLKIKTSIQRNCFKFIPKNDFYSQNIFWDNLEIMKVFDHNLQIFKTLTPIQTHCIIVNLLKQNAIKFYNWIEKTLTLIETDDSKEIIIEKILNMQPPTEEEALKSFINFYEWVKNTLPIIKNPMHKQSISNTILSKMPPTLPELQRRFNSLHEWATENNQEYQDEEEIEVR